jgi:hypothetical protein
MLEAVQALSGVSAYKIDLATFGVTVLLKLLAGADE